MRFSWTSLTRLALATLLLSSAAAIGLARLAPRESAWRMVGPITHVNINLLFLDPSRRGSVWLDRDGGPAVDVPTCREELLEYASCSPWHDERGKRQLVGRWSWSLQGETPAMAYGLARMTFPDGEVLDHIETEVVPVSVPCWYPGTGARVLFAAGDGKLYQHVFEPTGLVDAASIKTQRPRPLAWHCEIPGGGDVYLSDPFWPTDPRFHDVVFVGLRPTAVGTSPRRVSGPNQIWWLRLSEDGDAIVDAGRLFEEAPQQGPELTERCPTLAEAPDGRLLLAYFRRLPAASQELRITEVAFDPRDGCPRPLGGPGIKLAEDCLSCPPVFSSDGRWISAVRLERGKRALMRIRLGTDPAEGLKPRRDRLAQAGDRTLR